MRESCGSGTGKDDTTMAIVNASLLIGGLFVAVPIILHLAMRQKPRQLPFPAIRFVKSRRDTNRRRLQLRQWLLLALRCLAVLLLAAALARPSVDSSKTADWVTVGVLGLLAALAALATAVAGVQRSAKWLVGGLTAVTILLATLLTWRTIAALERPSDMPVGDREAPVSAVLVIDTSPRMQYRLQNRTRLEEAQETARWLIEQLPADSEAAVVDSSGTPPVFAVDLAAAAKSIGRLQTVGAPRPLVELLSDALELVGTGERARREIYVLTDLTAKAWEPPSASPLADRLAEQDDTVIYVVDVGAPQPQNFSLGELNLSTETVSGNAAVTVRTRLESLGQAGERVVELYLEEVDPTRPLIREGQVELPEAQRRDRVIRTLAAGASETLQFEVRGLTPGVHQGSLRMVGDDPLAIDNARYFTIEVLEAREVLVVADPLASRFFVESVAPAEFQESGRARYRLTVIRPGELANQQLSDYAAVCLLDPAPLPEGVWKALTRYVEAGGGLAVLLGHQARATDAFNGEAPQGLLGGVLRRQWRSPERDLFLDVRNYDHPVTSVFRELATSVPWNQFPVFRFWDLQPLAGNARTLVRYGNGRPALLERAIGRGRALTMTTPLSDPARPAGRSPWNELASGENNWPPFLLANRLLEYLVGSDDTKLNYLVGETAALPNHQRTDPQRYQLFPPEGEPYDVTARDGTLLVRYTDVPGAYRLKGDRDGPVRRGFAVNLPEDASELARLERRQLDEILGAGHYQFAQDRRQLERVQGRQRAGREFYPFLFLTLALVLGFEHLLANRFYRRAA